MEYGSDHDDDKPDTTESDEDIHACALKEFKLCQDAEDHNRKEALDDLRFARLGEQWPEDVIKKRKLDARPCMTFNRMPTFIRSVVNNGRQNKPAIKVHPADSEADPKTAEVINGLIRNIEYSSNADVAYDTGLDFAASCGIGYWRVGMEYSHDDTFDMDLEIQRVPNVFSVYGDYESTSADSGDWQRAFVIDQMSRKEFQRKYKGKDAIDWQSGAYADMPADWMDGETVTVAEYWRRKEVPRTIVLLSDGRVVHKEWLEEEVPDTEGFTNAMLLEAAGITAGDERETTGYEVTQYIMNGVEILKTNKWPGRYIPLIPVYGEELNVEGKRYFRSLIRDAKDAQRNFNYWRTTSTELVALAPKMPFIGKVGQFATDAAKWARANTDSLPYVEYDDDDQAPAGAPQRQGYGGVPAGALQEAANASDDMKSVIGIYDASLGARSNETSGAAINARKVQGENSTFHFVDNQARAIRHTGRVLIDLIPHCYNKERIIRVMGTDKKPSTVPINQQQPQPGQGQAEDGTAQIYNLTVGKYDLTVDTGPGFQTQREEAAYGMTELVRAYPPAAAIIAPQLAKMQDWPDADKIATQLEAMAPGAGGQNPQVQQLQQQLQQAGAQAQQLSQQLNDKNADHALDMRKTDIDAYNAETNRIKATAPGFGPNEIAAVVQQTVQQVLQSPDILSGGQAQQQAPQGAPAQQQPVEQPMMQQQPQQPQQPQMDPQAQQPQEPVPQGFPPEGMQQ